MLHKETILEEERRVQECLWTVCLKTKETRRRRSWRGNLVVCEVKKEDGVWSSLLQTLTHTLPLFTVSDCEWAGESSGGGGRRWGCMKCAMCWCFSLQHLQTHFFSTLQTCRSLNWAREYQRLPVSSNDQVDSAEASGNTSEYFLLVNEIVAAVRKSRCIRVRMTASKRKFVQLLHHHLLLCREWSDAAQVKDCWWVNGVSDSWWRGKPDWLLPKLNLQLRMTLPYFY